MKQNKAPLFDTVLNHARNRVISFHTPGHKNGRGMDKRMRTFTGRNMYHMDVTVFPEVNLIILGIIVASGRYTGFRITELIRFKQLAGAKK